jgi:hypothetical protein
MAADWAPDHLDKIEVALVRSAKIGNDTLIDAVGIHDDLSLGRLPEYFGEAHHWRCTTLLRDGKAGCVLSSLTEYSLHCLAKDRPPAGEGHVSFT